MELFTDLTRQKRLESLRDEYNEIVLVDTSWLMHRGHHAYGDLGYEENGLFFKTGHIYSVLRTAASLAEAKDRLVVFCKDEFPVAKVEAVPSYKDGRADGPDTSFGDIKASFDACMALCCNFPNILAGVAKDHEADDIIAALAKFFGEHKRTIVFSTDDDFAQLQKYQWVNRAKSYANGKFEYHSEHHSLEKFGVTPEVLPVFRTLRGDTSDNIAGINRMPKALAVMVANECRTFDKFPEKFKTLMASATPAQKPYLVQVRANYARLKQNYDLFHCMDSLTIDTVPVDCFYIKIPNPIEELLTRLQIGDTTRTMLRFIN